jgi:hypothetical protein
VAALSAFTSAAHPGRQADEYGTARLAIRDQAWNLLNKTGGYKDLETDDERYEEFVNKIRDIVRSKLGPFSSWKAGYRRSLGVSVLSSRARLSGRRAVVSVRLRARDRDACSGRVVSQRFRGHWTLAPRRDSWVMVRVRMRKTSGGRVRLSKSECPVRRAPSPSPSPPTDCQGYSPCLPPGSDVDCAGGSGDGPRYVNGPVYVNGATLTASIATATASAARTSRFQRPEASAGSLRRDDRRLPVARQVLEGVGVEQRLVELARPLLVHLADARARIAK